jgi:hypothetical protein
VQEMLSESLPGRGQLRGRTRCGAGPSWSTPPA